MNEELKFDPKKLSVPTTDEQFDDITNMLHDVLHQFNELVDLTYDYDKLVHKLKNQIDDYDLLVHKLLNEVRGLNDFVDTLHGKYGTTNLLELRKKLGII